MQDHLQTQHQTSVHYDDQPEFFASFLDPYMKYSTGIFSTDDTSFEDAAIAALDATIDMSGVGPQSRILEIGPGWGSLARRLSERGLLADYTAINPSSVQNTQLRKSFPEGSFLDGSFEELMGTEVLGTFDAIFLLGSICHLQNQREALSQLRSLLRPSGRIVLEDSWFYTQDLYDRHAHRQETNFLQRDVFGFAHITSVDQLFIDAAQAGLMPNSLVDTSISYRKTISRWIENLADLDAITFPKRDAFIKYLGIGRAGFGYTIGNYLIAFESLMDKALPRTTVTKQDLQ